VVVRKRFIRILVIALVVCSMLPASTFAATPLPPREKGLLITPIRQYVSGDAGKSIHSNFQVANLTDAPLTIALSVKQFSVADYSYSYEFQKPDNNWVHLSMSSVTLQPNRTQTVEYTVDIPAGTAPGGHYYTLFASANLESAGLHNVIQAADLVYLTVNGALTRVSHLESSSIQWISFGSTIAFTLQPINTGNIYSFVYVSSELHGLFVPPPQTSEAHLLIPGKVRELKDSIRSPVLPGIYQAVYGYKTDSNWVIQRSHLIVYIPPWFIAFLLAALLFTGRLWLRKKRTNTDGTPADPDDAEDIPIEP
jgi:hypothetical protein